MHAWLCAAELQSQRIRNAEAIDDHELEFLMYIDALRTLREGQSG